MANYGELIDYLETLYNRDYVEFQDYINIECISESTIDELIIFFDEWLHNERYVELLKLVRMTNDF